MSSVSLYVLLLVCLAMASGIVHKIQTQHHALSSEHSKHLFGHASLRRQQLYRRKVGMQASVGKLPLQEDDYLIVGTITVGTPPQSFNVEVDAFFDNELLLIGANATLSSVSKNIPKKNTYNASSSSTYVSVNGNVSTSYVTGHKAQDVLNIGSLSATIKSFVVADVVPFVLRYYAIDGVLGLSPRKKSYYNVSVVADELIDQLDQPLISIYSNSGGNGTGQVTLGAEDTDNCQSTWTYVPAIDYFRDSTPFRVHASSAEVTIGGQLTVVNLDSNVTFVPWFAFEAPFQAKDAFVNGTGASYNASIGEYTIDCDTTKAPLITLNLGGVGNSTDSTSRKLVLSGADYIRYWKRMNVCYLGVTFYFDDDLHREFILGSQVLNNHCISFNYKERTVGFADSKTPKTDVTKA
ncbi:eukaryotic aspartyl protease domain-containing protein [Ditylenchus destructor]|uniref:Eukaryotic aspartyl protease domain-containing protein n=1 Tax=Ditylenchus destructor TaxID=166010 RepID=A0AAD4MV65_9BILA|nr:eukaryotic aspartyl protease domain-containing protein [Ditylenchus destructor]